MVLLSRTLTVGCCLALVSFFGIQYPRTIAQNRPDIAVQEATTQAQVTANAATTASLQAQLQLQEQLIGQLRDEVSTQKGVGIGVSSVIGLMQLLQIGLQFRGPPRRGRT